MDLMFCYLNHSGLHLMHGVAHLQIFPQEHGFGKPLVSGHNWDLEKERLEFSRGNYLVRLCFTIYQWLILVQSSIVPKASANLAI